MLRSRGKFIGHGTLIGLVLAMGACAGRPFGREQAQPLPPPMPVHVQAGPLALPNDAMQASQWTSLHNGTGAGGNAGGMAGNAVIPASYSVTGPRQFRDISLNEAVELALANSSVLRDLGGRLVTQPGFASSNLNPVLIGSDARIGVDAALSAFDAQLIGGFSGRRNNRGLQQFVPLSTNTEIVQNQSDFNLGARRTFTTGTQVGLTNFANYRRDDLGTPPNRFSSAYTVGLGGDIRHPLAFGSGRDFNLIAGPNAQPGVYNGIFIARVRQDIAQHDFEIAVRDYVGNVVRSYWLLCFAYERMAATDDALQVAKELWEAAKKKHAEGLIDSDQEALARDRYLAQQIARDNAAVGSPDRTLSGILGTSGALLSGTEPGVESIERRLRFLIGLPAYDGQILRPVDRPSHAPLSFDMAESMGMAMQRRPELNRQNLLVHQKQMELVASRGFARPRVDLVSELRVLGFGDHLGGAGRDLDQNAVNELLGSELKEWALGVEMQRPVGLRLGKTAVRNALLSLNKESEVLKQQQIQVSHEINAAITEIERAQKVLDLTLHRREIALSHLSAVTRKFDEGFPIPIEEVLEGQRAATDAETAVSIAAVDRAIAINNFLIARGTYLQDLGLMLIDSPKENSNAGQWNGLTPQTAPQVELGWPQATSSPPSEVLLLPPES